MRGKFGGEFEAVEFDLDEMFGQQEFVEIQLTVFVYVGKVPNTTQNRVGKLGFLHFLFGLG